jgi:hypothetical protein
LATLPEDNPTGILPAGAARSGYPTGWLLPTSQRVDASSIIPGHLHEKSQYRAINPRIHA